MGATIGKIHQTLIQGLEIVSARQTAGSGSCRGGGLAGSGPPGKDSGLLIGKCNYAHAISWNKINAVSAVEFAAGADAGGDRSGQRTKSEL